MQICHLAVKNTNKNKLNTYNPNKLGNRPNVPSPTIRIRFADKNLCKYDMKINCNIIICIYVIKALWQVKVNINAICLVFKLNYNEL